MKSRYTGLSVITITLSIIISGILHGAQAAPADRISTTGAFVSDSTSPRLRGNGFSLQASNTNAARSSNPADPGKSTVSGGTGITSDPSLSALRNASLRANNASWGPWLNLDVTRDGLNVQWRWQMQTDDNVESYVAQYSLDGTEFFDVGQVTLFTDDHTYELTKPLSNYSNMLFRVKQVNLDGTENFSPIQTAQAPGNTPVSILTYPNPAISEINIQWPFTDATSVSIYVSNNMGKILIQENQMISTPIKIDLNSLTSGIYYIYCIDNKDHRSETQSFSKLPQ